MISEGEEGVVLGVSRDDWQGEGKMEEEEEVLNSGGRGETGKGFVEYEDDYQDGGGDLLPDPGLTVEYEDEGWHGWEEGLGGPGFRFKEKLLNITSIFLNTGLDLKRMCEITITTIRSLAPPTVFKQTKAFLKTKVPPGA